MDEEPYERYAERLREIGLEEYQIDDVLAVMKDVALDALHDSKVRDWAWAMASKD